VNVVGGVKVTETTADLALLAAIISSFRDKPLPRDLVIFGEVGLSGEIRPVPSGQERIQEAAKHGFTKALVPGANVPRKPGESMTVTGVNRLSEVLDALEAFEGAKVSGQVFPEPSGAMDGGGERTGTYLQRVLERPVRLLFAH